MVMGPGTAPAATPPAIVERYTAEQIAAIKGNFEGPITDKDSLRHGLQVAAQPDPVTASSSAPAKAAGTTTAPAALAHDPWSNNRRQDQVNREINHASEDPATSYKPPPAIQAMLDEHADRDRNNLLQRLHISAVRADAGLGTIDRDAIVKLQSLAPAQLEKVVVDNMERKLAFLKPGDTLPVSTEHTPVALRLTADQTAALLKMRDEYRKSGPELAGRTPEEITKLRADYVNICQHFMVRDLNGMHQALLEHAFKGFDARTSAENVRGILKDKTKTDQERKLALNDEISKAGADHFPALMSEYAVLPEREMGKALYEALAAGNIKAMRGILAPRSQEDCQRLAERADQYAEKNGLKKPSEVILAYPDAKSAVREEYHVLMRGLDIKGRALDAYLNADHAVVKHAEEIKAAFAETTDEKGATRSALTAEQIAAIREEVKAIAVAKGGDPKKILERIDERAKGVVDKPVAEIDPQRANFRADVEAGNLKVEEVVGVAALATTYGFDAADTELKLRHAVEEFNGSDPTKTDPNKILSLLKTGSDPKRTQYLSPHNELAIVIQAYDSQSKDGPSLRETLASKLSGDARIQALQIIDQGFYAGQEAEILKHDLNRLVHIGDDVGTSQALMDRITQTDKEYKILTGKSLVEGIAESNLPDQKKAVLTTVAQLPTLDRLHDEFKKETLDPKVIESVIATPNLEAMYNAVYAKDPKDLRGTLEDFGRAGKLSRDFVMEQECVLEGLSKDTFAKLDAELDSAKPAIGTKDSVLRNKTDAQIDLIMRGFDYREEERAAARKEQPMTLTEHISKLNEEKKISSEQVLRAAMMLSGNDPFKTAEQIGTALAAPITPATDEAKQKEIALAKVKALSQLLPQDGADPVIALRSADQVRKIYEEEHGGARLVQVIAADKNIGKAFKNQTEENVWKDAVAAGIYGPGRGEAISAMIRDGNDPWKMSAELATVLASKPDPKATDAELKTYALNKLTALATLAPADALPEEIKVKTPNLNFQQAQVVRGIYSQEHASQDGGIILASVLADKDLPKAFDNDPEQAKYGKLVDGIAKNMYGEGMGDMVLDLESTISGLKEASTNLENAKKTTGTTAEALADLSAKRDELYTKLKGTLEASAGWGYLADEAEMYSVFFKTKLSDDIAGLEKSGAVTKAEKAELDAAMTAKQ